MLSVVGRTQAERNGGGIFENAAPILRTKVENSGKTNMLELSKENSRKIVTQALSFQRPDRLPVFDGFWQEFTTKWRQEKTIAADVDIIDYYWVDLAVPVAREELFPTQIREVRKEKDCVIVDDGWGRLVKTKPGTYFCEPVERVFNSPSDLDGIEFESPQLDMRYNELLEIVSVNRKKGRAVFVKIGGVFIRSSYFRGEIEFLMDMACDEPLARAIAQRVADHLLEIGLESLKRADAYDFGVWIYDDMCNLAGPMFSPATFERIFLPIYKKMISKLKAAGARRVILHCDGNLGPVLDMIIEAGFDGINPVESAAGLDVIKLVEKYHGTLSFIGGVCNTHVLPSRDEKRIREHVEAIVEAGRNGGLIIGTHSIGPDIAVPDYETYRNVVAEKGNYDK
ncbi:MAG: uroporphyrinogen decarboxylase family protein [Planctomycetota bacterium]